MTAADELARVVAHWWITKDGDRRCLELYNRHYSAYRYRDDREHQRNAQAFATHRTEATEALREENERLRRELAQANGQTYDPR